MTTNGHPLPIEPDPDECFWHGPEPIPPGAFRVCFECGHCYVTRDDLEREIRKTHQDAMTTSIPRYRPGPLPDVLDMDRWPFCPLCCHDF